MTDTEKPGTFGGQTFHEISDEMQWDWGNEVEILRDFVTAKGLDAELAMRARDVADDEIAEAAAIDEYREWANTADWPEDMTDVHLSVGQFREAMQGAVKRAIERMRETAR